MWHQSMIDLLRYLLTLKELIKLYNKEIKFKIIYKWHGSDCMKCIPQYYVIRHNKFVERHMYKNDGCCKKFKLYIKRLIY